MYAYFHCDAWKNHASMSLVGLFDEQNLRRVIKEDLSNKDIELEGDPDRMPVNDMANRVEYGFILPIVPNERI